MINTSSKTLGAQEKTQEDQAKSKHEDWNQAVCKITKNELTVVTGCRTGRWTSNRTLGKWLVDRRPDTGPDAGGNRPDVGQQRPIKYREVPERQIYDRTRPVAGDRTLASVQSVYCWLNGRDNWTRPIRTIQRPVSSRIAGVRPQRLLSQWGL